MAEPDPLESRITSLAALLRQIWRGIAKGFAVTLTTQGNVTMSDAHHVREQWGAQLEQLDGQVLTHIGKTYLDGAETVAELFDNGVDEPIGEDQVQAYLDESRNRLRGVGEDVWKAVRTQIKLGVDAGESIEEIATRVRSVSELTVGRSLTIARTETHAAYESGAYEQALFVDPNSTKVWVATKDTKTRETHQDANGQKVPISGTFSVGESALRFPGDPLGGGESINCRCTVFYEFTEVESPQLVLTADGKWQPHQHPRGSDGKFIKKGALSDLLSKGKPNITDVTNAVESLSPDSWGKLTPGQQTYIAESIEKLPPALKVTTKNEFINNVGQPPEVAVGTTLKPSAPKTTKIAPNFIPLLKSAQHGDVIATGTKNGKNFRVTAIKDLSRTKFNPKFHKDGVLKLEILKKDGTPSLVGGKIGDPYVISDALHDYYKPQGFKTKVAYDLTPGELHPAITHVLSNAGDRNLGGTKYQIGTQLTKAWKAVKEGHWDSLTPAQQKTLLDVTFTNGNENKMAMMDKVTAEEFKTKFAEAETQVKKSPLTEADYLKQWHKGLMTSNEFYQLTGKFPNEQVADTPTPTLAPSTPQVPATPTQTKIPAGLKGQPGDPAKVTTGVIWGKHTAGEVILESTTGTTRVIWDGKKFQLQDLGTDGTWNNGGPPWTKKDAYAELKSDTQWVIPGAEPKVAPAQVSTPTVESIVEAMMQAETQDDWVGLQEQAKKLPVPHKQVPVDFGGFQKVGGQKGSNAGGMYADPVTKDRYYVKKAKSEKHAANQIAASTLYALAGIDTPAVIPVENAPGLPSGLQTATKLVDGAKADLADKLGNAAYLKQLQEGFAVDAWLANWDVAGLVFDNVVTDVNGKPHRIDVGGTLLYRAQGAPKGNAFGDVVTEIDTLRDPKMNPQSAQVFGSMTDAEIRQSVQRVAAISEQDIDNVVEASGLPKSVAETLKNRRADLMSKYPPITTTPKVVTGNPLFDQFIDTGNLNSPSDFVKMAEWVDQFHWNGLTEAEKKTFADEIHEFGQATSSEGNTKTWKQAHELEKKLIQLNDGVNPAAAVFGGVPPKKGAKKAKKVMAKAAVPANFAPIPGVTPLGPADKAFLLDEATDQMLTWHETVSLINALDAEDAQKLSPTQLKHIASKISEANHHDVTGAQDALAKWTALQSIPGVAPEPSGGVGPKLTGDPITAADFTTAIEDYFSGDLPSGTVLAVTETPQYRIVWNAPIEAFVVEEFVGNEWVDVKDGAYYPDIISGDHEAINDLVDNMLHDWSMHTWLKPTTGDVTAPPPGTEPIPYTSESVIENWSGVLKTSVLPGTVVAVTPDGKYELERISAGWIINDVTGGSKKQLYALPDYGVPQDTLDELSETWIVPPKSAPKNITPDTQNISSKVAFATGLIAGNPGEIVVEGTNPAITQFKYRLRVGEANGDKHLILEAQNVGYDNWIQMAEYPNYTAFSKDWPSDPFVWSPPADVDGDSPVVTPPTPATIATPVAPTATGPLGDGADITNIPFYHKNKFKDTLKVNGNTGYWSKPEKIWDSIKLIQAEYPDPNNPGGSKYTPAQILKTLDALTNTKSSPTPYTDKMTKWVATAKGSAYVGGTGSVNPVQISKNLSPKQLASKLWGNATSTKPGVVVATGSKGAATQYQLVNGTTPNGVPIFTLQYMNNASKEWTYYYTIPNKETLEDTILEYSMKGTPAAGVPLVKTAVPQATPTPGPLPSDVAGVAQLLGEEKGDISHLTESAKQELYSDFKKQSSTYLSSPPKDIFVALKHISNDNGMSLLQALRVIDDVGAKKVGKSNEYLFEKKIKDWLKTPKGIASALGQPVPKPDRPAFKAGVSTTAIPSFADSSAYTYTTITAQKANTEWAKSVAQYGDWTAAERAGLKSYTGGIYYSINGYLYGEYDTISPTNEKSMKNAQLGMRPSTTAMLLHRGVGYNGAANSSGHDDLAKKVGQTWRNDGFSSSSVGGKAAFSHNPVIMEIEAPAGTPMAWLKPISQYSTENEMLLAAGLNFKIISVKKVGQQSFVRLRVVPDEETA